MFCRSQPWALAVPNMDSYPYVGDEPEEEEPYLTLPGVRYQGAKCGAVKEEAVRDVEGVIIKCTFVSSSSSTQGQDKPKTHWSDTGDG